MEREEKEEKTLKVRTVGVVYWVFDLLCCKRIYGDNKEHYC